MRDSLRRSWSLSTGGFWRIAGSTVLVGAVALLVFLVVGLVLSLVAAVVGGIAGLDGDTADAALLLGTNLAIILGAAVATPFVAGVVDLLYVDARMRREGLDVMLQRAARRRPPGRSPVSLAAVAAHADDMGEHRAVRARPGPRHRPVVARAGAGRERVPGPPLAAARFVDWLGQRFSDLQGTPGRGGVSFPPFVIAVVAGLIVVASSSSPPGSAASAAPSRRRRPPSSATRPSPPPSCASGPRRHRRGPVRRRGPRPRPRRRRDADDRTLLTDAPSLTAHEVGQRLSQVFPEHAGDVTRATDRFDAVAYGRLAASREDALEVRTTAETLRRARPRLAATAPAPPGGSAGPTGPTGGRLSTDAGPGAGPEPRSRRWSAPARRPRRPEQLDRRRDRSDRPDTPARRAVGPTTSGATGDPPRPDGCARRRDRRRCRSGATGAAADRPAP